MDPIGEIVETEVDCTVVEVLVDETSRVEVRVLVEKVEVKLNEDEREVEVRYVEDEVVVSVVS